MRLAEFMHHEVVTVHPEDEIDTTMKLMERHGIRHLPVIRFDGVCIGMVSDRDVLQAAGRLSQRDCHCRPHRPGPTPPIQVLQIMSVPTVELSPNHSVEDAISVMLEKKIDSVLVVCNHAPIGIATTTDFLRRYLDDTDEPRGVWRFEKVVNHMRREVITLRPGDSLQTAWELMRSKLIRHVPVVEDGSLVGMVSDRDLRRAVGRGMVDDAGPKGTRGRRIALHEIMSQPVVTVDPEETLADAAGRMLLYRIGGLPVCRHGELVGILTESDLVRALAAALAPTT